MGVGPHLAPAGAVFIAAGKGQSPKRPQLRRRSRRNSAAPRLWLRLTLRAHVWRLAARASPGSVPSSLRRPLPVGAHRVPDAVLRQYRRGSFIDEPSREARLVSRLKVQRNESFSVLVRDVQMAMDVDDVLVPSSRVKRSGPPKDSAVSKVRCSTWWGSRRGNTERSTGSSGTFAQRSLRAGR